MLNGPMGPTLIYFYIHNYIGIAISHLTEQI